MTRAYHKSRFLFFFNNIVLDSVPNSRSRQRSNEEQSQYMEDRKVALLLQNEEFLRELKRNEQFLSELNNGKLETFIAHSVIARETPIYHVDYT